MAIAHKVTVTIKADNSLEASMAEKSLHQLCEKLGAKKMNKLMAAYEKKKGLVDAFLFTL